MPSNPLIERSGVSCWPHRWAILLCGTTFPLLWVGGLVTSTDAGMAVPDWPGTYGYNMFAYPWRTWLLGPWDLFIEHGHRLLGSLVGLLTIGLLVAAWRVDGRRWLVNLSVVALLLVIAQGVLGGMRVVLSDRQLAMAHGCVGPLFFALTAALVVVTSSAWNESAKRSPGSSGVSMGRLLVVTACLTFVQLVLGAWLRHVPPEATPWGFASLVKLHLGLAGVIALHALAAFWRMAKQGDLSSGVGRLCWISGVVLLLQLALGLGTWLVEYATPAWASRWLPATMGSNVAEGWLETHIVTAHSAGGSLLLALFTGAAVLALRPRPHIPLDSLRVEDSTRSPA